MRYMTGILLFFIFIFAATAEVYKWVDANGKIHYSDTPPPPKEAKNLEQKKLTNNQVETDKDTYEGKLAAQKNPVTLYYFEPCGDPCSKAKALLEKRGVQYALKNQEQDKAELQKLTGAAKMPVLVVGKLSPSVGYEEGAWNSLLDQAGYPKSNPLAALRKTPAAPESVAKQEPAAVPAAANTPQPAK